MNYYSFHIGDYRRDTTHLSMLEHGAYRQLLDWIYLDEKPIPKEIELVFRRLSAKTKNDRKAIMTVLNEMFILTDNGYTQRRATSEITNYHGKAERARNNGKLGGRPKKTKVVSSRISVKTKTKTNQKLITNNHQPQSNEDTIFLLKLLSLSVRKQTAFDWIKLRKEQRATISETVIKGLIRESKKAELSLDQVLMICCERGWRGFKAEWTNEVVTQNKEKFDGLTYVNQKKKLPNLSERSIEY